MITKFSKFFRRDFARFMDNLYSKKAMDKPTLNDKDIESFFLQVTSLKQRIVELEEAIAVHVHGKGRDSSDNALMCMSRLTKIETHQIYSNYLRDLESDRPEMLRI